MPRSARFRASAVGPVPADAPAVDRRTHGVPPPQGGLLLLVIVTARLRERFEAEPWRTAHKLLERLQDEKPGLYPVGLLRTLQRRLKIWRRDKAHDPVFGTTPAEEAPVPIPLQSVT